MEVTSDEARRSEVQRIEFLRDSHNVRNKVTLVGDMKRVQVAFTYDGATTSTKLQPAWQTASGNTLATYAVNDRVEKVDEQADGNLSASTRKTWADRYCTDGKLHFDRINVFRTFALNDDGWLSTYAYGGNPYTMADLSSYTPGAPIAARSFGVESTVGSDYVRRARPLGRTRIIHTARSAGREYLPAYVEIELVDAAGAEVADSWIALESAKVLTDHCGFTLNKKRLDHWYPYGKYGKDGGHALEKYSAHTFATLLYNTMRGAGVRMKLRLVGTIETDDALDSEQDRALNSAWPFDAVQLVYARQRFRHEVAQITRTEGELTNQLRDDSTDIEAAAAAIQDKSEDAVGHGSIVLRHITAAYPPGMAIQSTTGRWMDTWIDAGVGRYYPIVSQVVWNFQEGTSKTELVLDSLLKKVMV